MHGPSAAPSAVAIANAALAAVRNEKGVASATYLNVEQLVSCLVVI